MTEEDSNKENDVSLSFWQITLSVLASMFGVQSDKNRERDFKHGNPKHFIAGGIIFTVLFLLFVLSIVKISLAS